MIAANVPGVITDAGEPSSPIPAYGHTRTPLRSLSDDDWRSMALKERWIACDESGNTGENLTQTENGVFSEGSHDLSVDESEEHLEWVRKKTRSRTAELK